jgi:hypothetical protein
VRDYPVEGKGSTRVELTMGREMVARWHEDGAGGGALIPGADMRPRREREGCARVAGEGEKWEGEEKGVRWRWGVLLSGCGGGDGLREAPHGSEEWGGACGPVRRSGGAVLPATTRH